MINQCFKMLVSSYYFPSELVLNVFWYVPFGSSLSFSSITKTVRSICLNEGKLHERLDKAITFFNVLTGLDMYEQLSGLTMKSSPIESVTNELMLRFSDKLLAKHSRPVVSFMLRYPSTYSTCKFPPSFIDQARGKLNHDDRFCISRNHNMPWSFYAEYITKTLTQQDEFSRWFWDVTSLSKRQDSNLRFIWDTLPRIDWDTLDVVSNTSDLEHIVDFILSLSETKREKKLYAQSLSSNRGFRPHHAFELCLKGGFKPKYFELREHAALYPDSEEEYKEYPLLYDQVKGVFEEESKPSLTKEKLLKLIPGLPHTKPCFKKSNIPLYLEVLPDLLKSERGLSCLNHGDLINMVSWECLTGYQYIKEDISGIVIKQHLDFDNDWYISTYGNRAFNLLDMNITNVPSFRLLTPYYNLFKGGSLLLRRFLLHNPNITFEVMIAINEDLGLKIPWYVPIINNNISAFHLKELISLGLLDYSD